MSDKHTFKSWNIIDCGLDKHSTGSHYWETSALAHELVRRGETVRILSHRVAPPAKLCPGAVIVPTFQLSLYDVVSKDAAWSALEHFIVHNRSFHHDLARLDATFFDGSVALFPMIGANQLLGLFRWLGGLPAKTRPKTAITLFEPRAWSDANVSARFFKAVWKGCASELRKDVAIFARTPPGAAMFMKQLGIPAEIFPYALPERYLAPGPDTTRTADPMVVSFVGGARRDRGCALIPDIVTRCSGMGVQFLVQVRAGLDPGFDAKTLTALAALPHVRIEHGALKRDDLYRAIGASVVLLPYRPNDYRWRDSGIYHEAKLLDAPILVTAGTWMADEVRSLGNGLEIENFSADAVVACIARAQRELPALKAAAMRVGKDARQKDGVVRCIETVAHAFGGPRIKHLDEQTVAVS
jgi:hypothetical protein